MVYSLYEKTCEIDNVCLSLSVEWQELHVLTEESVWAGSELTETSPHADVTEPDAPVNRSSLGIVVEQVRCFPL